MHHGRRCNECLAFAEPGRVSPGKIGEELEAIGACWNVEGVVQGDKAGTIIEVVKSSDLVDHVEKIPIDEAYPRWDPTDPEKPVSNPDATETEE